METSTPVKYTHAARCGERLRGFRKGQGYGLKDLASKAGISFQYLSRVEKGEVNTPIETLAQLADALGVSLAHVLGDEEGHPVMPDAVQRLTRISGELHETVKLLAAYA